jgi:hypothetical protein
MYHNNAKAKPPIKAQLLADGWSGKLPIAEIVKQLGWRTGKDQKDDDVNQEAVYTVSILCASQTRGRARDHACEFRIWEAYSTFRSQNLPPLYPASPRISLWGWRLLNLLSKLSGIQRKRTVTAVESPPWSRGRRGSTRAGHPAGAEHQFASVRHD